MFIVQTVNYMSLKFESNPNLGDIGPHFTQPPSGENVQSSLQKKVESATSEVFESKSFLVINYPITNMEVMKKAWSNKTVSDEHQVIGEKSVDELLKALEDPKMKLNFDFNTDRVDAVAKKNSICGKAGSSSSALNSFKAMIHFITESNLSDIEKQEKLEKFSKLPWPAEVLKYEEKKYGVWGEREWESWSATSTFNSAKNLIRNSVDWRKMVADFPKDYGDYIAKTDDEFFSHQKFKMRVQEQQPEKNGVINMVPFVIIEYCPVDEQEPRYSNYGVTRVQIDGKTVMQCLISIDDKAAILDFKNKWNERKFEAPEKLKYELEKKIRKDLRKNGCLQSYGEEIKDDPKYVEAALSQNGCALQYASVRLRNDPKIVEIAVRQNGLALQYASEELKGNPIIVETAINQNPKAIQYVAESIRESVDIRQLIHLKLRPLLQRKKLNQDPDMQILRKSLRKIINQPPHLRRQMASEVVQALNPRSPTVKLSAYFREPIENLTKAKKLKPVEKMSQLVSYERFVSALRTSFGETLDTILQSPPDEQSYVVLADESGKSTNWVASHVLDIMSVKPPQAIVTQKELNDYLRRNPTVKHVVMMDDGAYSGTQTSEYIETIKDDIDQNILHICIPFMTRYAKNKINAAATTGKIIFSESQVMFSYNDLAKLGFYVQKKMPRPDLIDFIKAPLVKSEGLPPKQMEELNELNRKVTDFKHRIFRVDDAHIKTEFKKFKLAFEKLSSDLGKIQMIQVKNDLFVVIRRLNEYAMFFKEKDTKRLGVKEKDNKRYDEKRSGTWMAHKSADAISSNYKSMFEATGSKRAIEPYKEGGLLAIVDDGHFASDLGTVPELRGEQLNRLPHLDIEGLIFVETNRGAFLLSENYIKKSTNESDVFLVVENEKIPFGGPNGAYQLKLEPDTSFVILKGETSTAYKYEQGKKHEKGKIIKKQ